MEKICFRFSFIFNDLELLNVVTLQEDKVESPAYSHRGTKLYFVDKNETTVGKHNKKLLGLIRRQIHRKNVDAPQNLCGIWTRKCHVCSLLPHIHQHSPQDVKVCSLQLHILQE